jgi:pimeloyl-ACP methyl ester carboxylesterase
MSNHSAGANPSLVLLHGFGFDHRIWDTFIGQYGEGAIYAPDLPGFGTTTGLIPGYQMKDAAAWLETYLQRNVNGPYILVGHSMGGYVALEFLKTASSGCKGLVLMHSHCFADETVKQEERMKKAQFMDLHGSRPFLELFYPSVFKDRRIPDVFASLQTAYAEEMIVSSLSGYMRGMAGRSDQSELLGSLKMPVLVYHGLHDGLIPRNLVDQMANLLGKGMVILDEKSGHMAMMENPVLAAEALRFFVGYCRE